MVDKWHLNDFGHYQDTSTGLVSYDFPEDGWQVYGILADDKVIPLSEEWEIYCQQKGYPFLPTGGTNGNGKRRMKN